MVCGIDEAGRGALAGPLVAAAVILPRRRIYRLRDSKTITANKRYELAEHIKKISIGWAVSIIEVDLINLHGIQSATYMAFKQAVQRLKQKPQHLLVDFYRVPGIDIEQTGFAFGDKISQSIAAASIIAKTTRDSLMKKLSRQREFCPYVFENNLGYGTKEHNSIIEKIGICRIHRTSYGDLSKYKEKTTQTSFGIGH